MREIINFNTNWKFTKEWNDNIKIEKLNGENITLPHTVAEIPLHYFSESDTWLVSGYQNTFKYDKSKLQGKRVLINFEAAMAACEVFVNEKSFGEHKGGYLPFIYDITDELKDGENIIAVKLDSTEREDIPPFGNEIDYLCYGGIYREVQIIIVNDVSIENVMLTGLANQNITGKIRIRNTKKESVKETIAINLYNREYHICEIKKEITLKKGELFTDIKIDEHIDSDRIELWDIDNPRLYRLEVSLPNEDSVSIKIGFRDAKFTENGFFLNDKRVKLRGLNRHQSFPYVGYAMPERIQKKDADILKFDLGLNIVRSSHYPASRHFLDRCDEIGLMVFEEIPGWQHIGDKKWQSVSIENVKDMIERDFHHASIIIWGVRINESQDNHSFYKETNKKAHELDKTRQTGGVRYLVGSELLEDVYTMNDFNYDGVADPLRAQKFVTKLDKNVPYMITEYNGHMFPTKMQDCEERLMEHTKRHFEIINAVAIDKHISGSTGWCAFDYHTHYNFGSGDRICYHGVYDMFRNPKLAASAYSSQMSTRNEIILEPITIYARGERAIGGISPLMVATNCDYVELYYRDELMAKEYPATGKYQGLKHAPVIIKMEVNIPGVSDMGWGDMKLIGYIDGKPAIEKNYLNNPTFKGLEVKADDDEINAVSGGSAWDSTRITVKAVDAIGNRLPYINEAITIEVKGAGELIGNDNPVLEGGYYSFWVKSNKSKGSIKVTVKNKRVKETTIEIKSI
ncbi:glycoside hydrolase family 2 protein [Brachyspira hyodysenteriae]|uniref:glycoside hydrolase family 2 protein n=1 Tax=Brachyspira hyodysenteriae TaxID=159 RepID=UPI0022CDAEF4|nr:glycoside hydrolase family 2 TIM barrel-domain containing protein [Brachyspira hyodysenteriae]MCZ9939841.1 glycoside hydrolase family 2 protein [Brachyspira hyodysenteriae]MDA0035669.1 glycoside hydrolase family 2 protein [Brachyspira hyodysenteriae]MDA0049755.1 glycoside hydrolase family 2 protein [Brachyspira hyodysenteriae]MDA0055472.1 glycoside hydrolase family 2 protein [Brachyspira hyodysenteriae]MDA0064001.1 glycoside hydrolase family 2 protein [Brachyspira hyodysenteriae]